MGMKRGELGRKVACWPGMESHRPPGQGHRDAAAPAPLRRDPGLGNLPGTPQASKERKPRKCVWWRGGDPTRRFPAAHPVPTPTRGAGHVCHGPVRGEAGFPGSSAREDACLAGGARVCVRVFCAPGAAVGCPRRWVRGQARVALGMSRCAGPRMRASHHYKPGASRGTHSRRAKGKSLLRVQTSGSRGSRRAPPPAADSTPAPRRPRFSAGTPTPDTES